MKGTEKQVKWAEEIRANIFAALDAMSNTSMKEEFAAFRAWLDNKDSAAWWIDLWQTTKTYNMFLRCAMMEYRK